MQTSGGVGIAGFLAKNVTNPSQSVPEDSELDRVSKISLMKVTLFLQESC